MSKKNTINKSDRDINQKFDINQFNKQFEINDDKKINEYIKDDEIIDKLLPHQKSVVDIIINIREMFYKIIDMLFDKQNPIPYIFSSQDRFFSFTIFVIFIGILLLLFCNIFN
jgi:hypothetical protein